jgi:hypothetical protein
MPARVRGALVALVALTASLAVPAISARAVDQGTLTLDATHPTVTWHGTGVDPAAGYGPPVCVAQAPQACDVLRLDVELPAGSFGAGDGVLVSVKWATDYDQYNLYVDNPDGTPAAAGIDVDSNAQSVLIKQPQNGVYTVRVVPFYTTFPEDQSYRGAAQVWHDPVAAVAPGTRLLPQLQTMPPSQFHIGDIPPIQSNPTGWRWTPDGTFANSCYLDEQVDYGSTRCLRFDNDIRNVGAGALKLRFRWDTNIAQQCEMEQEIDVVGGDHVDRNAGPCIFHPQHAHFHYQNMAWYQLFPVDGHGNPGALPVAKSYKLGFCTIDVDDYTFGGPAAAQRPRTYSFPTCNVPYSVPTDNPAVWEYMGISPGWGDVYTWDLPAQYLDVSHVGDGTYELVSRANPDGGILEAATGLETGVTCITITGNAVKVVQSFPSQSNSAPLPHCGGGGGSGPSARTGVQAAAVSPPGIASLPNTSRDQEAPAPAGALPALAAAALCLGLLSGRGRARPAAAASARARRTP